MTKCENPRKIRPASQIIDKHSLVTRKGEKRRRTGPRSVPSWSNHLDSKDGVLRTQIILLPPLPLHSQPIPTHPKFQTIHDGFSPGAESQHDTKAPGSPRPHGSREVQSERSYHPQRRSTCATNQLHFATIADLLAS